MRDLHAALDRARSCRVSTTAIVAEVEMTRVASSRSKRNAGSVPSLLYVERELGPWPDLSQRRGVCL